MCIQLGKRTAATEVDVIAAERSRSTRRERPRRRGRRTHRVRWFHSPSCATEICESPSAPANGSIDRPTIRSNERSNDSRGRTTRAHSRRVHPTDDRLDRRVFVPHRRARGRAVVAIARAPCARASTARTSSCSPGRNRRAASSYSSNSIAPACVKPVSRVTRTCARRRARTRCRPTRRLRATRRTPSRRRRRRRRSRREKARDTVRTRRGAVVRHPRSFPLRP